MNDNNTILILGDFLWDIELNKLKPISVSNEKYLGKDIILTPKQFRLLQCLYQASPQVLQHKEIVDFVWDSKPTSPESLPQLINRTRLVLEDKNKCILVNEPKVGYSLNFTLEDKASLLPPQ